MAVMGLAIVGASILWAQTPPSIADLQAQQIQAQQQQKIRDALQQFQARQNKAPAGITTSAGDTRQEPGSGCAVIRRVKIAGMTRYTEKDFAKTIASLITPLKDASGTSVEREEAAPCTDVKTINQALRAITNRYIGDGYVTSRAFVGPQNLQSGTLVITVFEGHIQEFKSVSAQARGAGYSAGEIAASFPAHGKDRLNLRALEQGIDQLARLASAEPKLDIAPGDTPTTSIIIVKHTPKAPWLRPSFTVNDSGAASTGQWQGTSTLDADSVLGAADQWSFYYSHNLNGLALNLKDGGNGLVEQTAPNNNESYGGFVSVPHGWWTISASLGGNSYTSVVKGSYASYQANGMGWNSTLSVDHMLYRNAATKISATFGLSLNDTKSYLRGIELQTSSYRMVTGQSQLHYSHKYAKSLVQASLSYNRGLDILGAYSVNTGKDGATINFNTWVLDASWQKPFKQWGLDWSYTPSVKAQWGLNNLFPAQSLYLGGSSTIRGYNDAGISGRTGFYTRQTLSCDLGKWAKKNKHWGTGITGFIAYDAGQIVHNAQNYYERGSLQSASLGARLQNSHMLAEATLSKPLAAPAWLGANAASVNVSLRIGL